MQPCQHDKSIEYMRDDIREMKQDIKKLLGFRASMLGMATVVSVIISTVVTLVTKII